MSDDKFVIEYHFPRTLDAIPYLNATNKAHLANDFFMFDGSGDHQNTSFTIRAPSVLRVQALFAESQIAANDDADIPMITLLSNGANVATTKGAMLQTLQPGQYMVVLSPPASFTQEDDLGVPVTVQLAISPVDSLNSDIAKNPNSATCSLSAFDNVLTDATGYFHDGFLYGTIPYSSLSSSNNVIATIPFNLDRYSLVYLQVGAQFLLDELDVRILAPNGTMLLHGRIRKNVNEIHEALQAGTYRAIISMPYSENNIVPSHCGSFSYALVIKDGGSPGTIIDCSTLNQLPWQLDSVSGGSSPYGGPIAANGTLHLFGQNMHVPDQLTSNINFTVSKQSLISVLATGWVKEMTAVDFTLKNSSNAAITPRQNVLTSGLSRLALYVTPSAQYQLGLNYRTATIRTCYSYNLQIDVAPTTLVQNAITCATGKTAIALPTTFGQQTSNSYDSFFQGWNSVNGMSVTIPFNITTAQSVVFTLSFNSLVNSFTMKLNNVRPNGQSALLLTGQIRGQPITSGFTNVYSYISTRIRSLYCVSFNFDTYQNLTPEITHLSSHILTGLFLSVILPLCAHHIRSLTNSEPLCIHFAC